MPKMMLAVTALKPGDRFYHRFTSGTAIKVEVRNGIEVNGNEVLVPVRLLEESPINVGPEPVLMYDRGAGVYAATLTINPRSGE